jgi:hypothetical protein
VAADSSARELRAQPSGESSDGDSSGLALLDIAKRTCEEFARISNTTANSSSVSHDGIATKHAAGAATVVEGAETLTNLLLSFKGSRCALGKDVASGVFEKAMSPR